MCRLYNLIYTNIPIKDCLTAIDLFCRSKGCEFTALITKLSRFVLKNNYFEADGVLYGPVEVSVK